MSTKVKLEAKPQIALVDDVILVTVSCLQPHDVVTLAGLMEGQNVTLISHAYYEADKYGVISLQRHRSLGGTYTGVEPMGFIWSMHPDPSSKLGSKTINRDVEAPLVVDLFLLNGHVNISCKNDIKSCNVSLLDHCRVLRYYMSPKVKRMPLQHPILSGTLFVPPGTGPFPGVIDLYGRRGCFEFRAAALASRGFVTLALAFTNYDSLPSDMDLTAEQFEEAVEWLYSHDSVIKTSGGVGIIGLCKGASIALYLSTFAQKVKAVVAINPICYLLDCRLSHHGMNVPVPR